MPRSVAEIQAEIAKVKQEIATRDMYRQPRTQVGWASYVGNGDRGLLDAYQNREDQYNKMMKQQQFQAAERALQLKHQQDERLAQQAFQAAENERNRENAYNIAAMNKEDAASDKAIARAKAADKERLEAEIAQAEYDDAINKVDLDKPETVLAARKAAIKLNYANRNLPYYADDPQSFTVATEFTEDAKPVAINKKVNNAIQVLDPIVAAPQNQWTEEQKATYKDAFDIIKQYKPELITKYQIEEKKKGKSKETIEAEYEAALKAAGNSPAKIKLVKKKYNRM